MKQTSIPWGSHPADGFVVRCNPLAKPSREQDPPDRAPLGFHRAMPAYAPSPLVESAELASAFGIGTVWLKDETSRFRLPSFKILGASWAVAHALCTRLGLAMDRRDGIDALRGALSRSQERPMLVAATDGNHGQAVARMARVLDLPAKIFVPANMAAARLAAIAAEGALVIEVAGGYDAAVHRASQEEALGHVVVSDTSWPGYEEIPRSVIDGYSTCLWEIDDQLRFRGRRDPDVVFIPVGVGALAAAVCRHYRATARAATPLLVSFEPFRAACLFASIEAGRPVRIPEPQDSIMSGLNCGTPSPVAWPYVSGSIDLLLAIDDEFARAGMRDLATVGIAGGECSGGGVGAARGLLTGRHRPPLGRDSAALIFLTEGPTDPEAYRQIVGSTPDQVRSCSVSSCVLQGKFD